MTQAVITSQAESYKQQSQFLATLFQILGGSLFIGFCSQIQIPLYFTPVPITLQTLAVMLVGGFLGRKNGSLSLLAYFAQISAGLPVLAGGAAASLALIGPTGGYLLGMLLQAYLVGWCFEQEKPLSSSKTLAALALVAFIQLAMGSVWLGYFVGWNNCLFMGFYPFIPGEILKCIIATVSIAKYRK